MSGRWLWTEGWHKEDDDKAKMVLFRAAFNGRPENAGIRITADTRSQILYTYAVSADDRLARKAIDDFRRSQREDGLLNASYPNRNENVIPGFSIYYILMIHDLFY